MEAGVGISNWVRAQSSVEYLLVFAVALVIITISSYVALSVGSSANKLVPQSCSFNLGIYCSDIAVASNSTATMFALIGHNAQEYSISNLSLNVSIDNSKTTISCTPRIILPGQPFVCVSRLSAYAPYAHSVDGKIIASTEYCALDNCANAIGESYVGAYSTEVSKLTDSRFGIMLSSPIYAKSGADYVNVNLNVFGSNFTLEKLAIGPYEQVLPTNASPSSYFVNVSGVSQNGAAELNVSYAGLSANETVVINTQLLRNAYCLNESQILSEILQTAFLSSYIQYPNGASVFTCPVYNNTVYCGENTTSYFASLKNAELGDWSKAAPYQNSSSGAFACLVLDNTDMCWSKNYVYYAPVYGNGIGVWEALPYPVIFNYTFC
ncbi:MAG: hypothetical protein QW091_01565 [Candidatus Micrarchaeaceae archaeon]